MLRRHPQVLFLRKDEIRQMAGSMSVVESLQRGIHPTAGKSALLRQLTFQRSLKCLAKMVLHVLKIIQTAGQVPSEMLSGKCRAGALHLDLQRAHLQAFQPVYKSTATAFIHYIH